MKKVTLYSLLAVSLSYGACKSKGNADFTNYVAIGNSLTAGFADGTLYRSGQINSYPNMLASQFELVGGGKFNQPLLPGESGWPNMPSMGYTLKRVLGYSTDCTGATSLSPVLYSGPIDNQGSENNIAAQGPFNNFGIPGIRCIDYSFVGYGLLNPYAGRMFSDPNTQSPLQAMSQLNPTFFTLWLGSNDVLGYATSGGEGAVGGTAIGDISNTDAFRATYNGVVQTLVSKGAKGVLINIPDVTSIPYFTTIAAKGLNLSATQAAQLTAGYAAMGLNHITFEEGANYFVVVDPTLGARKMEAGEYILLTTPGDSLKCGGWGSAKPIPKRYVLSKDEVAHVQNATATFNGIIADAAAKHGLGLMDANAYLKKLNSGITWNGVTNSPTFVTGGAFSLDGVHLTPRGYALVANEILHVINQQYQSTIPDVDVNKYHGVLFP
jgi:lysophospholipase L1-like esterase